MNAERVSVLGLEVISANDRLLLWLGKEDSGYQEKLWPPLFSDCGVWVCVVMRLETELLAGRDVTTRARPASYSDILILIDFYEM